MNFLELTSYIGGPQGYADRPEFSDDVWPLLMRKRTEIEGVFLFRNDRSRSLGWAGEYAVVSENIVRIRPMDQLTEHEIDKLKHWSFYGGHLNVLYRVSSESSLLRELCNLYPTIHHSSDDVEPLGLDEEFLPELRVFTAASPSLHLSFAHDGDPLYVFGELEALRELLRNVNRPH